MAVLDEKSLGICPKQFDISTVKVQFGQFEMR
jgi:hypothetical protein